jgi:hypothetical protein
VNPPPLSLAGGRVPVVSTERARLGRSQRCAHDDVNRLETVQCVHCRQFRQPRRSVPLNAQHAHVCIIHPPVARYMLADRLQWSAECLGFYLEPMRLATRLGGRWGPMEHTPSSALRSESEASRCRRYCRPTLRSRAPNAERLWPKQARLPCLMPSSAVAEQSRCVEAGPAPGCAERRILHVFASYSGVRSVQARWRAWAAS